MHCMQDEEVACFQSCLIIQSTQYSLVSPEAYKLSQYYAPPKKKWHKRRALTESVKILNIHTYRKPIVCDKEPLSPEPSLYIQRNKIRKATPRGSWWALILLLHGSCCCTEPSCCSHCTRIWNCCQHLCRHVAGSPSLSFTVSQSDQNEKKKRTV